MLSEELQQSDKTIDLCDDFVKDTKQYEIN